MFSPPRPALAMLDARVQERLRASDDTLVIIGARGWMGSATLAMLDAASMVSRVRVFGSAKAEIVLPSGHELACEPLSAMPLAELRAPHVLHFAYATKDKLSVLGEAGFIATNQRIQALVAEAITAWRPRAVFFPSSGAVYASDLSLPENLYGRMKRQDEAALAALAEGTGMRLQIARIFTMAGEYINKTALYAVAAFLNDVKSGGPIRIHAAHRVLRSYAYIGDVVTLALAGLLEDRQRPGTQVQTFDVAGSEAVELGVLAALCRKVCGRPDMPILRPAPGAAAEDRMLGNAAQYEAMLRQHGLTALPLEEQIRATAQWLGAC